MTDERQDDIHVGVRTDDYGTSIKAARRIGGNDGKDVSLIREQVYAVLMDYYPGGLSQGQVRELCDKRYGKRSESSYRKRVPELAEIGLAERMGKVRTNAYGNSETIWRGVPPGGKPSFSMPPKKSKADKQRDEIKRLRAALVEIWASHDIDEIKQLVQKTLGASNV